MSDPTFTTRSAPDLGDAPAGGLDRRRALLGGAAGLATGLFWRPDSAALAAIAKAAAQDDRLVDGTLPPLPANWTTRLSAKLPAVRTVQSRAAGNADQVLLEYRMIGCPMFGATHANINWQKGHYYSFRAPRSGTVTGFMWQTQGARQHADPSDQHSGGTFGCYRIKFYSCAGWGLPKGAELAQARVDDGELGFYPGRQKNGYDAYVSGSPQAGAWNSPELRGGLHVHAWLNRVQTYDNASVHTGTGYVFVDVTSNGAPWTVTAGEWLMVEFVNLDPKPTVNFSLDNNAFAGSAAHPGRSVANSPLDPMFAVREYLPASGQPNADGKSGGARDMIPFFMLRYSDEQWYGQPWYYRGRYTGGSTGGGLFDESATVPAATGPTTPPVVEDKGPCLIVYGARRLRQVLTPPADFATTTVDAIYAHAFRWRSLAGYDQAGRLGVRIMRVTGVSGNNLTNGLTQLWPPAKSTDADTFKVAGVGPFKAFPIESFVAFGQDVVPGRTLTITPSNLTSRTSPTLAQFEAEVACINYGSLAISPPVSISAAYRYVIEFAAESGSAYALQLQKNPTRYINLVRKLSTGAIDTSQGRAFQSNGKQRAAIVMPQVWPCNPLQVANYDTEVANNKTRYYNAAGKYYGTGSTWTEFHAHMLPVCLKPTA